jgi:hypothetical protein
MSYKDEYEKLTTVMLLKRAAGTITDNEEEDFLDKMDDLWWKMSEWDREEVNTKFANILEQAGLTDIV